MWSPHGGTFQENYLHKHLYRLQNQDQNKVNTNCMLKAMPPTTVEMKQRMHNMHSVVEKDIKFTSRTQSARRARWGES